MTFTLHPYVVTPCVLHIPQLLLREISCCNVVLVNYLLSARMTATVRTKPERDGELSNGTTQGSRAENTSDHVVF